MERVTWQQFCRRVKRVGTPGRELAHGLDAKGKYLTAPMPETVCELVRNAHINGQEKANRRIKEPHDAYLKALSELSEPDD
jgi:hypothetical protein